MKWIVFGIKQKKIKNKKGILICMTNNLLVYGVGFKISIVKLLLSKNKFKKEKTGGLKNEQIRISF